MKAPFLTIGISTTGRDGIERVAQMLSAPLPDSLYYIVSWQNSSGELPATLVRPDVLVDRPAGHGLSRNRNNVLRLWNKIRSRDDKSWLLIADDDLRYDAERLERAISRLRAHPELDYAAFAHTGSGDGAYPDYEFDLDGRRPRGYYITSFNLAVSRGDVMFDTNFGLGAGDLAIGEEQLWVHDLRQHGARGRFFPVAICEHKHPSSGLKAMTAGQHQAHGIILRLDYPLTAPLRIPLIARRYSRSHHQPLWPAMKALYKGYFTPRPKMKQLVIFDLDGTLLDTIADLGSAANHAMEALGFPTHPLDAYPRMVGNGITRLIERALPAEHRDEATVKGALKEFLTYYGEHCCDMTRPYEGIPELLDELQRRGVLMAVASNKYQAGTGKLIAHFFPGIEWVAVEGQREGRPRKPDPRIINEIIAAAGVAPGDVLEVGDSDVDMLTAHAARVTAVGVDWGFRPVAELRESGAHCILHHPLELLDYLD